MASARAQLDAPQSWTTQLKPVQDAAAKVTEINNRVPAAVADVLSIHDRIPDAAKIISGSIPDAASMIQGYVPDTTKTITGSVPDAASVVQGYVSKVTPIATGTVPSWPQGTTRIPGDFTSVTSGLSLDEAQRAPSAFSAVGLAQGPPASGATFQSGAGLIEAITGGGQTPVSPQRRQGPVVLPKSLRRRPPTEHEPRAPRVLPQELGEALAESLTRRYRQEAKGLLVALGLDLELEHLEAIEKRLLDGGRPDRLQAALSASLLLKGVADRLYPPRAEEERWTCRFGKSHKLSAPHVKNRLHAFADPFLRRRSTAEHKLFVAELDLVSRWTGEGHHVVFSPAENAEAFCALLKVVATVARAQRLST